MMARQPRPVMLAGDLRVRGAFAPVGVDATPLSLSVQSEREDLRAMTEGWEVVT